MKIFNLWVTSDQDAALTAVEGRLEVLNKHDIPPVLLYVSHTGIISTRATSLGFVPIKPGADIDQAVIEITHGVPAIAIFIVRAELLTYPQIVSVSALQVIHNTHINCYARQYSYAGKQISGFLKLAANALQIQDL